MWVMRNLVLVGIVAFAALAFANNSDYGVSAPSSSPYKYETHPAEEGAIRRIVSTSGTVRPLRTVQIGSEISGRVKSISADFNERVEAGHLLAVIDPKTFESKALQASADLASAKALLFNAEAAVRKQEAILENAQSHLARQKQLDRKGISSASLIETAERDVSVARADLETAKGNVMNAKAAIAQRQAQREQTLIDLERTQIRSPMSGIVLSRTANVGQTVAASFQAPQLFLIADDLRLIHIEAQVSEADIGSVREGNPVVFDVDAYPDRTFNGKVEQVRLAPDVDGSVVTYTVVISAQNEDRALFPGMTANVRIETASRKGVMRVPTAAIRFKPPRGISTGSPEEAAAVPDGDRVEALIKRWSRRLGLDAEQIAELRRRTASLSAKSKSKSDPTDGDASGDKKPKKGLSAKFEAILISIANETQRATFAELKGARDKTRRATVWLLSPEGVPRPKAVRTGLSDTQFTELVGNDLKAGEHVIVRSRKIKAQ